MDENKDLHDHHHIDAGTAAKWAVIGGMISSLGQFIAQISTGIIAIEKIEHFEEKHHHFYKKRIMELENEIHFLANELNKQKKKKKKK